MLIFCSTVVRCWKCLRLLLKNNTNADLKYLIYKCSFMHLYWVKSISDNFFLIGQLLWWMISLLDLIVHFANQRREILIQSNLIMIIKLSFGNYIKQENKLQKNSGKMYKSSFSFSSLAKLKILLNEERKKKSLV